MCAELYGYCKVNRVCAAKSTTVSVSSSVTSAPTLRVIFTGFQTLFGAAAVAVCVYSCSPDGTARLFLCGPAAKGDQSSGGFSNELCITAQIFHYGMVAGTIKSSSL